ncbi:MAG: NifU family protein [Hyphomicrobium sp.]|uniref:NifU family protein n=1 Tax=Hyphomicrobium sp. TaxID=82 RepID=UPI003D11D987
MSAVGAISTVPVIAPESERNDIAHLVGDIERLEMIFEGWDETARGATRAYGLAIETLNGEALRRLVAALKRDPAALAAMKAAVTDEVVYAVMRRHGIVKPSLTERVEAALESIRPMLASHGGDVELVGVNPPAIEVRFTGSCDGCPASALTFHAGVKKAVEEACPEITDILQVKGTASSSSNGDVVRFVSPFALGASGQWHFAAKLSDVPEGGIKALLLEGEKVLISRRGSIVTCFQNACAHLGLALDDGEVEDGVITCPYHGFRYDLSSGECLTAPAVQLQPHAVRVVGSRIEVRLQK